MSDPSAAHGEPPPFDAVVVVAPDAHAPFAGTTLVTRAAFVLARGGARRLLCVGTAPRRPPRLPRLPITWAAADDLGVIRSWTRTATPRVVVLPATTVTDATTVAALVAASGEAELGPPAGLAWRVEPSRIEAAIAALATHATPAHTWEPPATALLIDATTEAGRARATHTVFARLGRAGDSWFTRHVDRRFSRAITRLLLPTGVAPNVVTLVSIAIGISAGLLFASGDRTMALAGAVLFLFSTIVDGCDGEIARLTFRESRFGARLDVVGDNVVHLVLFTGIAIGLYRPTADRRFVVLGALLAGGLVLSMVTVWWSVVRHEPTPAQRRLFEAFASREFAYALVVITAADLLEWFLWVAVLGNYAFSGALLLLGRRRDAAA